MRASTLAEISLVILDVDGVLTDGRLYFGADGEMLKCFNVRDGQGIRQAAAEGVRFAVISGRKSRAVTARCRELGIDPVIQGCSDKLEAFRTLTQKLNVLPQHCACIGDDAPDVPLMVAVGLAFAVADAHPVALAAAHRVTQLGGGAGAVREVCDLLVAAHRRRK